MLEAYGVWQEKNLYGQKSMGIVRTTFIIDPAGKIRNIFPKVKVEGHSREILDALSA
jgi:peroxiredoxin Q/BCP